eukprot:TRINITY_DN4436_c0_g1_i1.p1 TRINITY_DN4436_c0_g1~~TRINITY_DN4436_c0_g1_i1.p1  ORF type:complete len:323 (-),score=8.11 TRINITY_DN4436_c0_g1_i1:659-1627(-)
MTAREQAAAAQREAEGRKRMSCNGCRVLRKGCSDSCILRPCLQWIESAEAQGHATVFVAKFFGRAGLMSFISAVPENQRPALFQSLLYEACGRTVNPVYGAVGLLASGNWHMCQAAVESVLRGGSLRPARSSSGVPTCSSRPSLTGNVSNNIRLNNSSRLSTVPVENHLFPQESIVQVISSLREDPTPEQAQQRWLGLTSQPTVKSEPVDICFQESKEHILPEEEWRGEMSRKIRKRCEANETSERNYADSVRDRTINAMSVEAPANLDLTLNCEGSTPSRPKRRISSPSLVSVNSEGSVTSLESGTLAHTSDQRIMLDLFP